MPLHHEPQPRAGTRRGADRALALAPALLAATDMVAAAALIVEYATGMLGCSEATVLWSPDFPDAHFQYPQRPLSVEHRARAQGALATPVASVLAAGERTFALVLCTVGTHGRVVLLATRERGAVEATTSVAEWEAFVALTRPCLAKALELARLEHAVRRLEQAERLQHALFAIADMASSDLEMPEMLRSLHQIVGGLMYAENFFIVLHDAAKDAVRFIYFADLADNSPPSPDVDVPMESLKHGVTWYLIRNGRPLMGTSEQMREQDYGSLEAIGPDSLDCLGVPMLSGTTVRGAIVVQSYIERPRYTAEDQALLSFVASHILTALDRKQAQEELERRVAQRTQELAEANAVLTGEVFERKRSERLQNALFRIAELASTAGGMKNFFTAVHGVVGELINAENFYIAMISDDGTELRFPYSVDEREPVRESRPLANGITEFVLRSGEPLLLDAAKMQRLRETREIGVGPIAHSWLGIPLLCGDSVVGVVAVQSYSPDVHYTMRDEELLNFVSSQIAHGLERRRAAEDLKIAYAELEQRVVARTGELSEQIGVRECVELALKHRNADLEAVNQKLAGTQSQLLQSEKMASVGQLAAGVAHEINNPIGFVHSNLGSLKCYVDDLLAVVQAYEVWADAPTDHAKAAQLAAVKEQVQLTHLREDIFDLLAESVDGIVRVKKIVQDLRDFSHLDEAEWQEVDLHHGLESTLNVVANEIKYKADLVKDYGDLPPIKCLPFQINQVMLNLLVNAAQAIELRGTITIRTGHDDDAVWVRITDTGSGIDPAHMNRIFDPFFTTKPVGVGTGLGLSVSYGIVQKHGGTIDVTSEIGVGTTFTVRLPMRGTGSVGAA